jgi:hypothetical protein
LGHLVRVDLGYNKFSGEVPIEWWRSRLVFVNLGHNALSGSLPAEIKYMKDVAILLLHGNHFTSAIPEEIGELTGLQQLWLFANSFQDQIPATLAQLETLSALYLHHNFLTGSLPRVIGDMKQMMDIRVHKNSRLGGDIPESFYNLTSLMNVDYSECRFTGTISSWIGNLKELSNFMIHDNAFSGTIPVELARNNKLGWRDRGEEYDQSLGNVQIQSNQFQGKMSDEFCDLRLHTLIADCSPDPVTGDVEMQCDCCTKCCDAAGICTFT